VGTLLKRSTVAHIPIDGEAGTAHIFFNDVGSANANIISPNKEKEIVQIRDDVDSRCFTIHHKLVDDFGKHPRGGRESEGKAIILMIFAFLLKPYKGS
jgi:hypothetical protein